MAKILWFKEIGKNDVDKVGGKGANLGELVRLGAPVPPGFCITVEVYWDFVKKNNLAREIKKELTLLNVENNELLERASAALKEAILRAPMPAETEREIISAYKKLGEENYVAVRSSATAEDSPGASFAGQQVTFLNVRGGERVVEAVRKCWASLFEPRSIYYRVKNGFDHSKVGIAVPVQKMVQSETSGVLFTADPTTANREKIIVEGAYGLGEVVVSGAVNPDHYVVDKKSGKLVEKKISRQTWTLKRVGRANERVRIAKGEQEVQKVPDALILEIAKIGVKIEKHYNFPQDSEWAIENGQVFFVQTRPITTLDKKLVGKIKEDKTHRVILRGAAASVGAAAGKVQKVTSPTQLSKIEKGDILVAKMTNPSYVPAMKRASGIVTDQGGQTSHAAIVSRELAIPCVVGTEKATHILKDNQLITVDGAAGLVYEGDVALKQEDEKTDWGKVPHTKTKVYVNLAEKEAAERVAKMPCDGVGLLRAEFMLADIGAHPRAMLESGRGAEFTRKLADGIRHFARAFSPRPVIYRTTDFKTNEYRSLPGGEKYEGEEANPMIGYRGAMRYVQEPEVFALELAALAQVRKQFRNVHLMIPFVRTIAEMEKIKLLVEDAGLKQGEDFKLMLMCEVPSTVIMVEEFLDLGIDGFSIGSNDLTQLTLGLDRDNEKIAFEFDERDEAVMRSLEKVVKACKRRNALCSICGQAPSIYPEVTEALVRWGVSSVSVNPDVIVKTKELVAKVEKELGK